MFIAPLSPKQEEVLNLIINYIEKYGYPPSIREIGRKCNIHSSGSVSVHLDALVRKKYIERNPRIPRGIKVIRKPQAPEEKVRVVICGEIAAGKPILADERYLDEFVEVTSNKIPRGRELFALKVRGDSMINANIHNGDTVIIAKQNIAQNGDIVVALIDDECTLKKFKRVDNYIALLPANPEYDPIPIIGDFNNFLIQGKLACTICDHN